MSEQLIILHRLTRSFIDQLRFIIVFGMDPVGVGVSIGVASGIYAYYRLNAKYQSFNVHKFDI